MRNCTIPTAFLLLITATAGAQDWPAPGTPHLCAHAKAEIARLQMSGPLAPRDGLVDGMEDTDVLHHHLEIELDPVNKWLGGSNTMTVRSLVSGLSTLTIQLWQNYEITEMSIGGTPVNWQRLDYANIEVTLDRPYDVDEVFELRIAYGGKPGSQVAGAINFDEHQGVPMLWTHSQPWWAFAWRPAKEHNPDKTTADLWITVPDTLIVASNGVLKGVDDIGLDQRRYRWETDYPTSDYLYCFGATNYDVLQTKFEYDHGEMPIELYVYPESNTPENTDVWLATPQILSVFSDLYGLYPFVDEKYGMAQTQFGGGMEHQTLTTQGGFWEWITIHEASHQWWGDHVTCATWHDIWLNEGMATYSEALFYEYVLGEEFLHLYMNQVRRPGNVNGTVYCYDISDPGRIFDGNLTYMKGAWCMHMLRWVVGSETYFKILAAYRDEFAGGTPTTEDFQRIAEEVSGRDLDWFFYEWVYMPGAPKYRLATRVHDVNGQGYLEIYARQAQSFFYPIFTMPVELRLKTDQGESTAVVWNAARVEHRLVPLDSVVFEEVVFDPNSRILSDGYQMIAFEEGPPKIVALTPEPNQQVRPGDLSSLEVVFHKDVVVQADDITLVGVRNGPIATTFGYNLQTQTASLLPALPLPTDTYTLVVSDEIVDVASQQQLDGELVKPYDPNLLPSGDGVPGGATEATFQIVLTGDVNCSNDVGFDDIQPFVLLLGQPALYESRYPGCPVNNGDINLDGRADFDDINPFIDLLNAK